MGRLRLLLWPAGMVLGVAAESALYGFGDARLWVPDLAAGWSLIACGLIAWARRPDSRSGALMTATGGAWFAGNFFSQALYLHRGPLVQLVLTYPSGRLRGRVERVAVAIGYGAAVSTAVWRSEQATIVLSALLVAVACYECVAGPRRERGERLASLVASAAVALVLVVDGAVRLSFPTTRAASATLLAYQLSLCVLATALLAGLIARPWQREGMTDLVVELGEGRSGTVRDALARALGDPTLEVGFWHPESQAFVDGAGRPVDLRADDSGRAVTRVELEGHMVAVLIHDAATLDDPRLVDAVDAAARLGASNARLHAEVREHVTELHASRRRLVRAGDAERRRLEQRLRDGAERRLTLLGSALSRCLPPGGVAPGTVAAVRRAQKHVAGTLAELHELAGGLHPRALTDRGLAGALASLAEDSPVAVDVSLPDHGFTPEVEAAAYFICSEALANVVKHACASRVAMTVTAEDDRLCVEVVDNGVGGANPAGGTGIRGLGDRVEALGGTLRVQSPPGRGTRLSADLPLTDPLS